MMIPRGIVKASEKFVIDRSPSILTALGVTGAITTAVLTGRAAYRVGLDVNAGHYEPLLEGLAPERYTFKEKVKIYWREFVPAAVTGTWTVVAIIAANRISNRRAAALAAAYTVSEKMFSEYKDKVIERLGTHKEQAVRDELAQERVSRTEIKEVIIAGSGDVLCFDAYTGRYFTSSMEELKRAQNNLNYTVLNNYYASLGDFYRLIGLDPTSQSEEVGWNSDKMLEIEYSTVLSPDGRPCISINFVVAPIRNYYRIS